MLLLVCFLLFVKASFGTSSANFYANNPDNLFRLSFVCYYHVRNSFMRFETPAAQAAHITSDMTACMQVFWPKSSLYFLRLPYASRIHPFEYFNKGDVVAVSAEGETKVAEGDGFFAMDPAIEGISFFVFWHPERPADNIKLLKRPIFPPMSTLLKARDAVIDMTFKGSKQTAVLQRGTVDPSKVMLLGEKGKHVMTFAHFKYRYLPRLLRVNYKPSKLATLLSLFPGSILHGPSDHTLGETLLAIYEPFELIPPHTPAAMFYAKDRIACTEVVYSGEKYLCIFTGMATKAGTPYPIFFRFDALVMD